MITFSHFFVDSDTKDRVVKAMIRKIERWFIKGTRKNKYVINFFPPCDAYAAQQHSDIQFDTRRKYLFRMAIVCTI